MENDQIASKIELRINQTNNLLGSPFSKSMKYGNLILNGLIILILLFLTLYKYPVVISEAIVVARNQSENHLYGIMMLDMEYINKIKEGDIVNVKLDELPHQKLNGYIQSILYNEESKKYELNIAFESPPYHVSQAIHHNELCGRARIVVKYESLLSIFK